MLSVEAQQVLDSIKYSLRIELAVERQFGQGTYLAVRLKFDDETISENFINVSEIKRQLTPPPTP